MHPVDLMAPLFVAESHGQANERRLQRLAREARYAKAGIDHERASVSNGARKSIAHLAFRGRLGPTQVPSLADL